jgi:hypothetical protein
MSRGTKLQEMEVGTTQSKTAVNSGAAAADQMPKLTTGIPAGQTGSWEDLGGPTPENYKSDDNSAQLKTPGATLKQVKSVVNKGAGAADAMKTMNKASAVKEEEEIDDEVIVEEENEDEDTLEAEIEVEEETEEESEEVLEEIDIEEDINALLSIGGSDELSEEFKEKAKTIFEAAITSKVNQIRESLEEQYEERLIEEVQEIKSALEERVDSYLEYVSGEWIEENQLSIEQGLKEELTESFMTGLKGLFEEHYVSIPEDKYDVLESMVEKLDDMETKLNEQIERNVSLNKRLAGAVADGILDQVSEGLADTQKEKLASLAESVEFESEEKYRDKLETLRESYFSTKSVSQKAKTESLSEGVDSSSESISGPMASYLKTLSAFRQN